MLKAKLTKPGQEVPLLIGEFHGEPVVGEPFEIGSESKTPEVTEILTSSTFRCDDVIYEWKITNGDF